MDRALRDPVDESLEVAGSEAHELLMEIRCSNEYRDEYEALEAYVVENDPSVTEDDLVHVYSYETSMVPDEELTATINYKYVPDRQQESDL